MNSSTQFFAYVFGGKRQVPNRFVVCLVGIREQRVARNGDISLLNGHLAFCMYKVVNFYGFLGASVKLRKATVCFVMPVRLSA